MTSSRRLPGRHSDRRSRHGTRPRPGCLRSRSPDLVAATLGGSDLVRRLVVDGRTAPQGTVAEPEAAAVPRALETAVGRDRALVRAVRRHGRTPRAWRGSCRRCGRSTRSLMPARIFVGVASGSVARSATSPVSSLIHFVPAPRNACRLTMFPNTKTTSPPTNAPAVSTIVPARRSATASPSATWSTAAIRDTSEMRINAEPTTMIVPWRRRPGRGPCHRCRVVGQAGDRGRQRPPAGRRPRARRPSRAARSGRARRPRRRPRSGCRSTAGCTGWPSQVPLRKSLIGRMGRNSADTQRWLKSPNGLAQRSLAATSRARNLAIAHLPVGGYAPVGALVRDACPAPPVHISSTSVGNSGITLRHRPATSWIRPLWRHGPARYIPSCPKGRGANRQAAPRSDPRDGPRNQVRGPQGQRARDLGGAPKTPDLFGAAASRLAGPPTSSFGRFAVSGTVRAVVDTA